MASKDAGSQVMPPRPQRGLQAAARPGQQLRLQRGPQPRMPRGLQPRMPRGPQLRMPRSPLSLLQRTPSQLWRRLLLALALVVVVIGTWLLTAPATFADWVVARATAQRVRIADATGSIWEGSGRLVIVDTDTERLARERGQVDGERRRDPLGGSVDEVVALAGVPIPGKVAWKVQPWPLLLGRLEASAHHDSMSEPVTVSGNASELVVSAGAMQLPSIALDRLGSPWNAIRPAGALAVNWQPMRITRDGFQGRLFLDLRDVSSVLTPVRPLGAYRLEVDARGAQAELKMSSMEGPLRLSGNGNWSARAGLHFRAEAEADESERLRLQSMLGLLGPREGNRTLIRIGA